MNKKIDYSVYLITDHTCLHGRDFLQSIEAALRGGVTLVQLREKNVDGGLFLERALAVKALCDRYNIPLLINDRIDIALASKAAGVHLGQEDIPLAAARKLLGSEAVIGISTHNAAEAVAAENAGADYLGVGSIFPTNTKGNASEVGVEMLKEIRRAIKLPIVGIGGINADNCKRVIAAGAEGAAIISGILGAEDIENQVRKIKKTISG